MTTGCTSKAVQQQNQEQATNEVRITATPKATPHIALTNFSRSLSCMDELFIRYNISNLVVGAQDLPDATEAVIAGAKDMLITALSRMSVKSNAVRFVALGSDLEDVKTFHALHPNKRFRAPDFFIRGGVTQADQSVIESQTSGGLAAARYLSAQGSKDRISSIITLDMNVGLVSSLQMMPGITASNSIAVTRKGKGLDLTGSVEKLGAVFDFTYTQNEGLHHALRTLVELGTIELAGKLTQVPYWECLDIETTNPFVQAQILEWFEALNEEELRYFVQAKLKSMGKFDGEIDGLDSERFRTSVAFYKSETGLIKDSKLGYTLYYSLIADKTPINEVYLPLVVREITNDSFEGPEDERVRTEIVAQNTSLESTSVTPLDFTLQTDRGRYPVYSEGEYASISVQPSVDANIYCFYQPRKNEFIKIFPNRYQPESRVLAKDTLTIPATDDFRIRFDDAGVRQNFLCLASYADIETNIDPHLRHNDLEPLNLKQLKDNYRRNVASLDDIYQLYKSRASVVPLKKELSVEVN